MIGLEHIDPSWLIHTGNPESYFYVGHEIIGFYPKPSSTTDIIELTCAIIPDKYTKDIDRIKVRGTFQWAIVNYAVSEYWAGRGDAKEAEKHFDIYMDNLGVVGLYQPRNSNIPYMRTDKNRTEAYDMGNRT